MNDFMTQAPLHVSTDGTAGPYIMVPASRLKEVQRLLEGHEVRYSVEEEVISVNGTPEVAVIDLPEGVDVVRINAILRDAR